MLSSRSLARALQRNPRAYQASRRLWARAMEALPARHVAGIPGRVHPADLMLESRRDPVAVAHYADAGRTAVGLIEEAIGDIPACSYLDLGCGHGRVVRWLVRRVEPGRVTVADIDRSAVRFCRSEFGVSGFVCTTEPQSLAVTGGHDVVWMGSVITHLDLGAARSLLRVVREIIAPHGAVIVTQHDPARLDEFAQAMPWVAPSMPELRSSLASGGWAYADYPHHPRGYGLAFATDAAMEALAADVGMRPVLIRKRGWLEQDAWVLSRVDGE